jgi:hypothetical protein
MAKVLFMMDRRSEDLLMSKQQVQQMSDNDLVQLIAFTDAIMFKRCLTDNEKHNFWLVIDEKRARKNTSA